MSPFIYKWKKILSFDNFFLISLDSFDFLVCIIRNHFFFVLICRILSLQSPSTRVIVGINFPLFPEGNGYPAGKKNLLDRKNSRTNHGNKTAKVTKFKKNRCLSPILTDGGIHFLRGTSVPAPVRCRQVSGSDESAGRWWFIFIDMRAFTPVVARPWRGRGNI